MTEPDWAPLTGFRVAVTSARRAEELSALLTRRGAAVTSAAAITMVPLPDDDELRVNTEALIAAPPDIVIATDDMYEHILWTGQPFVNIVNACPELYDRTVVMNGVSKAYSMTGWRIGYAGGPQKLIAAMKKVGVTMADEWKATASPAAVAILNSYMAGQKTN